MKAKLKLNTYDKNILGPAHAYINPLISLHLIAHLKL